MRKRARWALIGVGVGIVALFVCWYAAFHIGFVERADQMIFRGFGGLRDRPHVGAAANAIAHLCNPNPYVYLAAIPIVVALLRRRVPVALTVGGIILGANVTTELLKPLLAEPRAHALLVGKFLPPDAASWPSGHATAAMSLTLCMILASPARFRPAMAMLGAAFTIAVVYSFLALGWHYPTDVLGGFLVATTWTLLGVAALFAAQARHGRAQLLSGEAIPTGSALAPPIATILVGAGGVAAIVLIARPAAITSYAKAHETFVLGAAGIAIMAMALATGVMVALVRRAP